MKISKKILSLFAVGLISATILSCTPSYYKTVQQPDRESVAIKDALEFKVRPIDFSAINAQDLGYSNSEEWSNERMDVPKTFADSLTVLLKEAGVENKKIIMMKSDKIVSEGIVVDVKVKKVILRWNFFNQKPDEYLCDVSFTDAASSQKLFFGIINVTTRGLGRRNVGGERGTIPINPGMPGWEGTFSGRLHIATYNIAWVLTKIMVQGKIDPAVY